MSGPIAQTLLQELEQFAQQGLVVWMAKGSEGGSGAHESGKSSDGKGKDGYTGKHEAPADGKGDGKK